MALTIGNRIDGTAGNLRIVAGTIDFDSSYPTGGEPLTAANIGLGSIQMILFQQTKGIVYEYDFTNNKVLAYVPGVTVGAAGAVTLDDFPLSGVGSTTTTSVSLTSTGGSATHRFGVMKEVGSTEDLSSIVGVRFVAFGF